jgi:hypothetical protein
MDAALATHNGTNYLLKFGDPYWLRQSFEKGAFRIAPASFYDKANHNHARRDKEMQRELIPNPRNQRVQKFMNERRIVAPPGKVVSTLTITSPTDYYLFSATTSYTARLFGDFRSDGVSHHPRRPAIRGTPHHGAGQCWAQPRLRN